MFITSAPSRLPASSNEDWVRVEASKNRLIWVRPRSEARFFSIWRLSSTNSSARSSRPEMSSRESPSIPSKWRLLRTNEDLGAMFIKAGPIGAAGGPRQGAQRRGPQARRGTFAPCISSGERSMAARIGTPTRSSTSRRPTRTSTCSAATPAAGGGGGERRRGRGSGAERIRPALGLGRDVRAGAARQREHAEAEDLRRQGLPARRRRVPSGLPPVHGRERARRACTRLDLAGGRHAGRAAGRGRARGALLHGGAGRERAHVPDHHDARLGRGARRRARAARAR